MNNFCKAILAFGFTYFLICTCFAEQVNDRNLSHHFLEVGDRAEDINLRNLINYPTDAAKISDFKGKLLILDFWSTHCAACINSWPKAMQLQKQFDGKVQFILVNPWEKKETVQKIFLKRKELASLVVDLPTVCGDSSLLHLFDISGVPLIVWINDSGYVKSISYGGSLNSKNINSILQEDFYTMPQKINNSELIPVAGSMPMFINGNG